MYGWLFLLIIGLLLLYIVSIYVWNKPNPRVVQQHKRDNYIHILRDLEMESQRLSAQRNHLNNISKKLETYKKLGFLYRDGVPDKYDLSGKKIKGVPPNAEKAIAFFRKAHEFGYLYGQLKIAKIYQHGMHNFEPQLEKALELYKEIVKTTPSPLIKKKALANFRELEDNMRDKSVHQWLNLDWKNPHANKKYQFKQPTYFQGGVQQNMVRTQPTANTNPVNVEALFRASRRLINQARGNEVQRGGDRERDPADIADEDNAPAQTRNDMHNVHDSGVLGTIRKSIQNLQENCEITKSVPQSVKEVRGWINGFPDNDKKQDALQALDAIERSYIPLSSTNIREVDALNLVWNRIHSPINKDNQSTLKDNLFDELCECIEHSKPVCSTGRFTRMLDTLNVIDPQVTIKPMYAIREEMMQKCGNIRDKIVQSLPEQERPLLDSLTENSTQIDFEKRFKSAIKNEFKNDYVDSNIMTEQQLENELNGWIDSI